MKKIIFTLIAIGMVSMSTMSMAAMSLNKVRQETRFLTDKMAYELDLSTDQYNDTYEINYDFIYNVRYIMDDVIFGYDWALDRYYEYLDIRNDDLRWVLEDWQYEQFLNTEYFYSPIISEGNSWRLSIYLTYTNPYLFYFGKPYHYWDYSGSHFRKHFNNHSFYSDRYHHNVYRGDFRVKERNVFINDRRSDFGRDDSRNRSFEDRSRKSSSRTFNDDLYNTDRSSGSSRSRTPSGDIRPSGRNNNRVIEIPSSDRNKDNSGSDVNRSRDNNTNRDRNTVRPPRNEGYNSGSSSSESSRSSYGSSDRSNNSYRESGNNNSSNEVRSSGNSDRSSSYNRSSSSNSDRSSSYSQPTITPSDRSSSISRGSVTRSSDNSDRSSSYSRPTITPSDRSSSVSRSSVTRSSDNSERSSSYSRPTITPSERSSSVSRGSSSSSNSSSSVSVRSSSPERSSGSNNESRSSGSSRSTGRTR